MRSIDLFMQISRTLNLSEIYDRHRTISSKIVSRVVELDDDIYFLTEICLLDTVAKRVYYDAVYYSDTKKVKC